MTGKTKVFFDFFQGNSSFGELEDKLKQELFESNLVDDNGDLTEDGLAFQYAVFSYLTN